MVGTEKTGTRLVAVASFAVAAILFGAQMAQGQSSADQYIPQVEPSPKSGSSPASDGGAPSEVSPASSPAAEPEIKRVAASESSGGGDSSGGTLPGTGTPLSTFAAVMIGLVALALLALLIRPLRSRFGSAGGG